MRWTAPYKGSRCRRVIVAETNHQRGPSVSTITTIGLDLAKKVFQVHGVDVAGKVVVARKLRRKEVLAFFAKLPPCLVAHLMNRKGGHAFARNWRTRSTSCLGL